MKTTNKIILFFAVVLFSNQSYGQTVDFDWIELSGDKVIVHYNLEDGNANRQFLINLYSSKDNFSAPLTRVTGDVGTEVKPGNDKQIIWEITKELGAFKGDLSLEVRGRIFVPFVKLVDFDEDKVFKRGNNYPITWTSGNFGGQINIELLDSKQNKKWEINGEPNSGKYEWNVPMVSPGRGYKLKFTNTKDRSDIQYSNTFTIKPKIPFIMKAGAVLIAGFIIYELIPKPSPTPTTVTDTPLLGWPTTFPTK